MIKAIPTLYNGTYYRSRLEARWAIFFDEIGLKFIYELEGFETPAGKYLPDFYFPDYDVFGEVKPKFVEDSRHKALSIEKELWLFVGPPKDMSVFSCSWEGNVFDYVQIIPFAEKVFEKYGAVYVCPEDVSIWTNEPSFRTAIFMSEVWKFESNT